jgi:hypothetical protein
MPEQRDTRAMPNGAERPGEHWNARLIREAAEGQPAPVQRFNPHETRPADRIAVDSLHSELTELHREGGSSNDFAQVVDNWFTDHGYSTILYA